MTVLSAGLADGQPALPGAYSWKPAPAEPDTDQPIVSVVIPCYNQARFLAEAVASVARQTYRNLEIVVVDDGSTDETPAVARAADGIVYVRQENQGLAAARNTGLRHSHGRFVVFLDADDLLLPTALEAGLRAFRERPDSAFVYGAFHRIAADGVVIERPAVRPVDEDAYLSFLQGNPVGMHATVMYRRDVIDSLGGFETSLRACEDYDLYLRIAQRYPVHGYDLPVAAYRLHAANMSNDAGLMLRHVLRVLCRQRAQLGADPRRREAYRSGRRVWKRYYAAEELRRMRRQMRAAAGAPDALKSMARFLAIAPLSLLGLGSRRALERGATRLYPILPARLRRFARPPVGRIAFGDLRRTVPISRRFGYDRGRPVDRVYIEAFLARHAADIRGRVLEIGDNAYTLRFGGDRVTRSDVLHVREGHPQATLAGDLASADHLPSKTFDCIILTQTLHLIYDLRAAVATLHRILKPGGVLLVTVPGLSQIDQGEWRESWYWSITTRALRRLLEERFPAGGLQTESFGNVLAAIAFLHGAVEQELSRQELEHHDPSYQLVAAARAVREENAP